MFFARRIFGVASTSDCLLKSGTACACTQRSITSPDAVNDVKRRR